MVRGRSNQTAQFTTFLTQLCSLCDALCTQPMFHEWATVQPGMICVSPHGLEPWPFPRAAERLALESLARQVTRKKRTAIFRQYVAAETAVPVIACAACLTPSVEKNFFFAGVARSKSVRTPDDGIGPRYRLGVSNPGISHALLKYRRSSLWCGT